MALVAFVHRLESRFLTSTLPLRVGSLQVGLLAIVSLRLLSLLSRVGCLGVGSSSVGLTAFVIQKFSGFAILSA